MQKEDHLLTKIFEGVSNELDAMGAVSKKAFWQVADHFLGIKKEQEIRVAPELSQSSIREEVRAEEVLKTKEEVQYEKSLQTKEGEISEKSFYPLDNLQPTESVFSNLVHACEQRLYDILERKNLTVSPERAGRIALQTERTATFILHKHGETNFLPSESEMVNFSLRAKYELERLPEIQQDFINEEERSPYRTYQIADRLASIEERLTFEARIKE
jgi:hypothetical protein